MICASKKQKTLWQRFYSAFGFWTYIELGDDSIRRVVYWYGFGRKWDLFSWKL